MFVCLSVQMPVLSVCTDACQREHTAYVSQGLSVCSVASAYCVCVVVDLLTVYMQFLASGPSADILRLADIRIVPLRASTLCLQCQ